MLILIPYLNSKKTDMKTLLPLLTILFFLSMACSEEEAQTYSIAEIEEISPHDEFFTNLYALCGETFVGSSTYPESDDHVLVGTELRAHLSSCDENTIHIDLIRGGDTWHATWVVSQRDDGLHLYHDHIGVKEYPEGEEPLTGYGGYADDRGTATKQYFPADDYTAEILPEASTNVWMMEMEPENGTFVYYLERHQEPRFRAELIHNN